MLPRGQHQPQVAGRGERKGKAVAEVEVGQRWHRGKNQQRDARERRPVKPDRQQVDHNRDDADTDHEQHQDRYVGVHRNRLAANRGGCPFSEVDKPSDRAESR